MTLRLSSAMAACFLGACQVSAQLSAGSPDEPQTASTTANPPESAANAPTSSQPVSTSPASSTDPAPLPPTSAPIPSAPATGEPTAVPAPTAVPTPTATEQQPAPRTSQVRTSGDRILLPGNVVFQSGQSILSPTPENETVLQQLKTFLDDNPKVSHVRIEGYTDNVGQPEANLRLSGERALAIKNWLVARGVATERLVAVGFGAERPIADNSTAEGRAQNRRTEFKIAAVNGNPYRGVPLDGGGTEFR